ncbi:Translation initiation factor subunit 2B [Ignavibacterium album JCM 16511]|uniref:Translation initiation factor subunit 2B n=1 Tax=Ignavibacterium album (strain DSM 19864 / JCM 16511 / NBRC 101810 / Mat9-16) TaxID=945713 RepID=I0AKL2_IGNAJ|nr:translation initiation factor subunit 2B [Ignavibacterium album]AFH49519.1 Translation initiation factor subunit 2B [Ignavibacterium album JCM 16511]
MKNGNQQLNKILNDNKSGSSQVLLNLKKYILRNLYDKEFIEEILLKAASKLNHFASVRNFLRELKSELKKSELPQLKSFLEESILSQEREIEFLFQRNKKYLIKFNSITTLSYSKTLLEVLKLWFEENPKLKIFVLESRPMLEGRLFVKELIKIGFNCELIADAAMNYAVSYSDAVVVGADQILNNGNVVNKIGSYPLALCAKENKKPFIVIATKDKFIHSDKFIPKKKSESEIWNFRHRKLKLTNFYFEEIPKKFITKIFS